MDVFPKVTFVIPLKDKTKEKDILDALQIEIDKQTSQPQIVLYNQLNLKDKVL